ncbi:dihydroorotase [Cocleimonas flava]|uniref:Dihydroorotase n=1 Tax=Cocleimonas flava TaxID=634765 RepID=A0A4R1EN25_9GAMM|nr:dihydroorotase [Cocleimonas flava]
MATLLILNAKIVNENSIVESDIYIRGGRIEKIAKDLSFMKVANVLDVKGKHVMPGMIDDQVHFREPGLTHKGDIKSESSAAVAGGVTTFFDMPNTIPNVLNSDILEEKMQLAAKTSIANYSFYHGASNDNLEDIKVIDPLACCGLKVFMGSSNGNTLVDVEETLDDIFKHAPLLVATHCEDSPTIVENEENYRQIYGDDIPIELHSKIRSEEACVKSTALAMKLAEEHQTRLHILHITTAKETEKFSELPLKEKLITAETCSQYLVFCDEDYETLGSLLKCNPSFKTAVDRAALIQGLLEGHLDSIGTNHAPHTLQEKQGNYFDVPAGLPMVQYALPSLLEHYQDGIFSLEFIASKTSHAVADIFNVKDRGYIREGYWADLVVVDLDTEVTASNDDVISKCGWTPFDGYEFRSSVHATIVNGNLVYINQKVRNGNLGQRIEFDRKKRS